MLQETENVIEIVDSLQSWKPEVLEEQSSS